MKSIEIENVQAIVHASIPIPDKGGVVILRGDQGTGKSTALQAVQVLAGKKVDTLEVRDGAKRGTIQYDGVKVVITKSRTAKTGELAFEIIEGRFDLSKIVDPGIIDVERADMARIKQLLALTAAKPNAEAYWALLREFLAEAEIDELDIDDETDDPIELHKRFVAAMQAVARRLERAADQLRVDLTELRERYRGINIRTPPSITDVRAAYDECLRAEQRMEERLQTISKQQADCAAAAAKIEELRQSYDGPTVEEAVESAGHWADEAKAAYEAMLEAEAHYKRMKEQSRDAEEKLRLARSHASALELAEQVLKQTTLAPPSAIEIRETHEAVEKAGKLLEEAVRANEGHDLVREGENKNFEADRIARTAEDIRNAGRRAEEILAATLKLKHLRVLDGRLVTSTDRDKNEPFAELSHGERSILAIREAARYVPPHGLTCISQEIWGGISATNKKLIRKEAEKLGIVLLTAEVTDGELNAEVMR